MREGGRRGKSAECSRREGGETGREGGREIDWREVEGEHKAEQTGRICSSAPVRGPEVRREGGREGGREKETYLLRRHPPPTPLVPEGRSRTLLAHARPPLPEAGRGREEGGREGGREGRWRCCLLVLSLLLCVLEFLGAAVDRGGRQWWRRGGGTGWACGEAGPLPLPVPRAAAAVAAAVVAPALAAPLVAPLPLLPVASPPFFCRVM